MQARKPTPVLSLTISAALTDGVTCRRVGYRSECSRDGKDRAVVCANMD